LLRVDEGAGAGLVAARAVELSRALRDPTALVTAVCRALGTRDEAWDERPAPVRVLVAAARGARPEAFARAVDRLREDPDGLLGAARLFFREGLWEAPLPRERARLASRLGLVALGDGRDDSKPIVLRGLGSLRGPESRLLLRDVVSGRSGREADASALGEEPGVRAGAVVALAHHGDTGVRPAALELLTRPGRPAERAAAEVALALLGDMGRLSARHFALRSYTLGLAGIAAVERDRARHGLDLLVTAGLSHPYPDVVEDAIASIQRLTGLGFQLADGSPLEARVAAVREWHGREGETFVRRQRTRR
jgi:hypothetical protein